MSNEAAIVDWSETRRMAADMISLGQRLLLAVETNDPRRDNVDFKMKVIRSVVAAKYGFSADDLIAHKRTQKIAWARHVALFLCRELTPASTPEIGIEFRRDHGCVLNSSRAVTDRCACEADFAKEVDGLRQLISQNELFKS